MILSSTSPYALLKEFSIACGFKYDAVFRVCLDNFCERLLFVEKVNMWNVEINTHRKPTKRLKFMHIG